MWEMGESCRSSSSSLSCKSLASHLRFTVFLVPLTDGEVMTVGECAVVGLEGDGAAADGAAGGSMQESGRMVVGGTFVPAAVVV